jgi:hypothetical protein
MRMNEFSTHQALLLSALLQTEGDILELGGGWYSTPLVNVVASQQKRHATTVENNDYIHGILKRYQSPSHDVLLMPGFIYNEVGHLLMKNPDGSLTGPPPDRYPHYKKLGHDFLEALQRSRDNRRWSVAFVDHDPSYMRVPAIEYLADKTDFIIVHDSEHVEHHGFEPTFSNFKYRYDFRLHEPNTVILSNVRPCDQFATLDPR